MIDRESNDLLYVQIRRRISDAILTGALRAGDRLPATTQMAEEYEVCHRTIQAAMNELVKEGLVVRRRHHGSFVADAESRRSAMPIHDQSVYVFLEVLGEDFTSTFYVRDMISGIRLTASMFGCSVKLGAYSALDSILADSTLAGLLLICPTREEAMAVAESGVRAVQLDVGHPGVRLGTIKTNHMDGVMQGIDHLVGLGHKRILYVHSDLNIAGNFSGRERFCGFEKASARFGLPTAGYTVQYQQLSGRLKSRGFTAIMTDGHDTTIASLNVLRNHGISLPQGVSFVGYDDVELGSHLSTPLSAVKQRLQEVGARALDVLLEEGEGWREAEILVSPELIIRSSTMQAAGP